MRSPYADPNSAIQRSECFRHILASRGEHVSHFLDYDLRNRIELGHHRCGVEIVVSKLEAALALICLEKLPRLLAISAVYKRWCISATARTQGATLFSSWPVLTPDAPNMDFWTM